MLGVPIYDYRILATKSTFVSTSTQTTQIYWITKYLIFISAKAKIMTHHRTPKTNTMRPPIRKHKYLNWMLTEIEKWDGGSQCKKLKYSRREKWRKKKKNERARWSLWTVNWNCYCFWWNYKLVTCLNFYKTNLKKTKQKIRRKNCNTPKTWKNVNWKMCFAHLGLPVFLLLRFGVAFSQQHLLACRSPNTAPFLFLSQAPHTIFI